MPTFLAKLLDLTVLKGHRTKVIQILFVLLAAYKAAVAGGLVAPLISDQWEATLVLILAERGFKFSKDHQPT